MKQPAKKKRQRIQVAAKDREYFTSNLALLVKSAVPLGDAIASLRDTTKSKRLKKVLDDLQADIDEGYSLTQALERSRLVSSQTLTLVALGEQSGKLVENLALAAQQEQKQRVFRAKLLSAMLYPAFVLGMTVIVGLGIAWFLLPKLSETFANLRVELPLISRILIGAGVFLKENGVWAVPLFLGVCIAINVVLFGLPQTRNLGMRLLLRLPGIGRLLRELEIARFGYLMGSLLQAGLPVTRALPLLERAATTPRYKKYYQYLSKKLREGYSFKQSFAEHKQSGAILPPSVQQIIVAGERSGSLSETLTTIGEMYDEKVDITTRNFEAIIEPLLLIIVWVGVMAVAVAVILPIYSLVGGLGG